MAGMFSITLKLRNAKIRPFLKILLPVRCLLRRLNWTELRNLATVTPNCRDEAETNLSTAFYTDRFVSVDSPSQLT